MIDTTYDVRVTLDTPFVSEGIFWYGVNNFCKEQRSFTPMPVFCVTWAKSKNKALSQRQGPGPVQKEYEVILDFPLSVGKQWKIKVVDTTFIPAPDTVTIVETSTRVVKSIGDVTVPAGIFKNCFEVIDSSLTVTKDLYMGYVMIEVGDSIVSQEWYAPSVGMIKQIIRYQSYDTMLPSAIPPTILTRQLKSYNVNVE